MAGPRTCLSSKLRVLTYNCKDQEDKQLARQSLARDLSYAIKLIEDFHETEIKDKIRDSGAANLKLMFQDGTTDIAFDRHLSQYEGGLPDVSAKVFVVNDGQVAANEVVIEMTPPDDVQFQVITVQAEWTTSNRGYLSDGSVKLRSDSVLQGEKQTVCQIHAIVPMPRTGGGRRRFEVPWRIRIARPAQTIEGSLIFDVRCQTLPEQLGHNETLEEYTE